MPTDEILNLARQVSPRVEQNHISTLSGGFSSQAYKVDSGADPFVLLVQRKGGVSTANYGHAYVVLTLLQKHGFTHAPEPLWLHNDHRAIAIRFYDGVASNEFDFSQEGVDPERTSLRVIDSLLDTAVITLEEYKLHAEKFKVAQPSIETLQESARKYGTEWFSIVKKDCPDKIIVAWLEPRIERSITAASSIEKRAPVFGHGDPSNPNILIRKDGAFIFIDWDSSRFHTVGAEFFVAYTTHLTDFMKPHRKLIIQHVADRLYIPVEEFDARVQKFRRFTEIFDVNWAAMMMAKVSSGEAAGDINQFRNIALSRIKAYDESFSE